MRVFPPNGPEIFCLDIEKTAGFWRQVYLALQPTFH